MTRPAIEICEVSKRYRLNARRPGERALGGALSAAVSRPFRRRPAAVGGEAEGDGWLWALRGVSFEVRPGEAVGVVGHNGAGKSTLLRVLSRLTLPTSGMVRVRGRIASMLGLGVGFNPELTGRENVYLNGVILGMTRAEVRSRFADVVEFSGLGMFIDVPVKQYSSGMKLRLGFSVVATMEPEILLLDEVLGVGDAAFRQQSSRRIEELVKGGRTVVLVTHSRPEVDRLCDRVIRLEHGRVAETGTTGELIPESAAEAEEAGEEDAPRGLATIEADPERAMRFREVAVLDARGEVSAVVELGEPFRVRVAYDVNEATEGVVVFCRVESLEGVTVVGTGDAECDHGLLGRRRPGHYVAEFEVPAGALEAGRYRLTVSVGKPYETLLDRHRNVLGFSVVDESSQRRLVYGKTRPGLVGWERPWRYVERDPVA